MTQDLRFDHEFFAKPLEFAITVPTHYEHASQLDAFKAKMNRTELVYDFHEDLTSAHFAHASTQLLAGKTYKVKIFRVRRILTTKECLEFLYEQHALLVGAQGLTIIYELDGKMFIPEIEVLSFDKRTSLWMDQKHHEMVPYARREGDGGVSFGLSPFQALWTSGHALLCVCED